MVLHVDGFILLVHLPYIAQLGAFEGLSILFIRGEACLTILPCSCQVSSCANFIFLLLLLKYFYVFGSACISLRLLLQNRFSFSMSMPAFDDGACAGTSSSAGRS